MVIEHVQTAFLHHWDASRTDDELADAMRLELSDTYPEVNWREANSFAYIFIQYLCQLAKNGLDPKKFTPSEVFLDVVGKTRKSFLYGVR